MKKIFLILMLAGLQSFGCWFTQDNFNNNYIAWINNRQIHYTPETTLASAVYYNNMGVSLPMTVYVKVSPRFPDQEGETGDQPITTAILQYKIMPSGSWITVKTLESLTWAMNFDNPVALFGKYIINPAGLSASTPIMIRVYMSDGIYETGDITQDITSTVTDTVTSENVDYNDGWQAPFVMQVIFNGHYTTIRK